MRFVLDGNNLIYALGLLKSAAPATSFVQARKQLLDWLIGQRTVDPKLITVVFDAQNAHGKILHENIRGVNTILAKGTTADDVIEGIVYAEIMPRELTVVSNDHRLHEAGKLRQCPVMSSREFVDHILDPKKKPIPRAKVEPSEELADVSAAEMDEWLEVFSQPLERPTPLRKKPK